MNSKKTNPLFALIIILVFDISAQLPEFTRIDTGSPSVYFTTGSITNKVEENDLSLLSIYPNPAKTHITIEPDIQGQYNIKITSLTGKLIFSEEKEGILHQIDLSSFQSGVYLITVRSKDFVTARKIVKY